LIGKLFLPLLLSWNRPPTSASAKKNWRSRWPTLRKRRSCVRPNGSARKTRTASCTASRRQRALQRRQLQGRRSNPARATGAGVPLGRRLSQLQRQSAPPFSTRWPDPACRARLEGERGRTATMQTVIVESNPGSGQAARTPHAPFAARKDNMPDIFKHTAALLAACCAASGWAAPATLTSPDRHIAVAVSVTPQKTLAWSVTRDGKPVILPSLLGLELEGADLARGLRLANVSPVRAVSERYHGSRQEARLCRVVDRKNEMLSERYSALKLDGPVLPAHKIDRRTTSYLCHRS